MIAKVIPDLFDIKGRLTAGPVTRKGKRNFAPTYPVARYFSEPLSVQCHDINELRRFLLKCEYVSDKEQFRSEDYWLTPERFEQLKKGDCDCFAMWTWRQLINMGYNARFVIGDIGKYRSCHAWVMFEKDGQSYFLEPQAAIFGSKLPSLSFARHQPTRSISWDGSRAHYYVHEDHPFHPPLRLMPLLILGYIWFWLCFWLVILCKVPLLPYAIPRKLISRKLRNNKKKWIN